MRKVSRGDKLLKSVSQWQFAEATAACDLLQQPVFPSDFLKGICNVARLIPTQAVRIELPRPRRSGKSPDDASLLQLVTKEKAPSLSLIHISEPTRLLSISYAVF